MENIAAWRKKSSCHRLIKSLYFIIFILLKTFLTFKLLTFYTLCTPYTVCTFYTLNPYFPVPGNMELDWNMENQEWWTRSPRNHIQIWNLIKSRSSSEQTFINPWNILSILGIFPSGGFRSCKNSRDRSLN